MSRSLGPDVTAVDIRETVRYQVDVAWSGPPASRVATYAVSAYGVRRGINSSTGAQVTPDGPLTLITSIADSSLPAAFRNFYNNTANPAMDAIP
jgi:hypothetical protein